MSVVNKRRKFKIYYGGDNQNLEKAGKEYKPSRQSKDMIVMNSSGHFFVYNGEQFYPSITHLANRIGSYDVKWVEDNGETIC